MNLNDFVVLPNKPKSVKLNTRNLRELRMETVQLAQESTAMESRLQQLRESMSREKEERVRSGGFHWKSGQTGALSGAGARRNRENAAPKAPGEKVKIRVLREEPLAEPRRPVGRPTRPAEQAFSRRPRLKGRVCGQCEDRSAGLMCAECGEDYCIGCFARFHQKGALKLHRMIPIQSEVQTSVSALDVVRRFQQQVSPEAAEVSSAPTGGREKELTTWTLDGEKEPAVNHMVRPLSHQASEDEEEEDEEEEEEEVSAAAAGGASSLLRGHFDEEESARSFQRALQRWRGEAGADTGLTQQQMLARRPHSAALPVSVEAVGTQVDLEPKSPRPIQVEFRQSGLCYMEKLLIKKHRRMPIEEYRPLSSEASTQKRSTPSCAETDGESHRLTEEEKELRQYLASLFAVSRVGAGREHRDPAEPTLSFVEVDQTVGDAVGTSAFGVERRRADTKLDGDRESLREERRKREERRDAGASSSSSSASASAATSASPPRPSASPEALTSIPLHPSPTPPPGLTPRAVETPRRPGRSPAASRVSSGPASVPSATPAQLLPVSPGGRVSGSPKPDRLQASAAEAGKPPTSTLQESPPKTPSPRVRPALSPGGVGFRKEVPLTPSPRNPSLAGFLQTPSLSELQPPEPRPAPSPPAHSGQGLRTPLQPPKAGSVLETSPATTLRLTRESISPRTPALLTPESDASSPTLAGHATPPAHGPPDCDPDSDPDLEEEEEREDWEGSVGLLQDQSDSSDEELRGCVGEGDALWPTPSPSLPSRRLRSAHEDPASLLSPTASDACRSAHEDPASLSSPTVSDACLSDEAVFTGPSYALQALAQRQATQAHSFLGLDGFLMLGVDHVSSARPGSGPGHGPVSARAHDSPRSPPPPQYSGGQLSWRLSSSLRESAPEELVLAVLESHIPRHTHTRPTSAAHRLHSADQRERECVPCPAPRPGSVSGGRPASRPTSRPLSRPTSRPLSRAAQEILEVQSVEREALCDAEEEEEEEEEDRQALASLEEEFRRMGVQPGDGLGPGVWGGPPGTRGSASGAEGSRPAGRSIGGGARTSSAARRRTSNGHPDEEEENLRDKHSVLALP